MKKNGNTPLVVTTSHRGVFFGYGAPTDAKTIRLTNARMVVYWPNENKSVLGLAETGPKKGSRVGPAVPAITLNDVTAVMEVNDSAAKAFEDAPWA